MDSFNGTGEGCKTLLIFWEGADWSLLLPLLQDGLLPNLKGLMERGSTGSILASAPFSPTPLFISALSGAPLWQHGVLSENGQLPRQLMIWDALPCAKTIGVNVPDICAQNSPSAKCLSRSRLSSAQALADSAVADTLEDLFVSTASLDPGLLRLLCPRLSARVARNDPLVQILAAQLARHYTAHNVAASLLETEDWNLAVLHFDFLEKILIHFAAYAESNVPGAPSLCHRRYGDVVKGACRLLDFLLADLLQAASAATCFLLSTRGQAALTESGARSYPITSPGAGLLIASGKNLAKDKSLGTVSLLDIVPTLRHLWGMPHVSNTPGRVLEELFHEPAKSGHETTADRTTSDPLPRPEQLAHQEALALGINLYESGKQQHALPFLRYAASLAPEKPEYAFWLACAQTSLGQHTAAADSEAVMLAYLSPQASPTLYRQAFLASQRGQPLQVIALLKDLVAKEPLPHSVSACYARALMESRQWHVAIAFLTAQLERQQTHEAWLGLARCYLEFNRFKDAEAATRHILASNPGLAEANVLLALSLHGQRRSKEAEAAFQEAEKRAPHWPMVQQTRAKLAGRRPAPREAAADTHRQPEPVAHQQPSLEGRPEFRSPLEAELDRFRSFLAAALPKEQHWHKRIWVHPTPYSHIWGAAAWSLPKGETIAKVALRLCPQWRESADRSEYLLPLFKELSQAGAEQALLTSLECIQWPNLLPTHPGLQYVSWTSEDWLCDPVLSAEALKPYSGFETDALARGWQLRPLDEQDWLLAQEWAVGNEYLESFHFEAVRRNADNTLSTVLEAPDGTVAGLLLVTRQTRLARIEFIVGNPAQSNYWPLCTICLFGHLTRQAIDAEICDAFTLSTNLNRSPAMHRLAHRLKMIRTGERSHAKVSWSSEKLFR